ncbi:MAG: exodeoxyribonuclease V subunit gamma [Aquihabitans sp.]
MLHLHAADRPGPLAARLASVLSEAPADPMAPEWIATPTEGMRRWLWLELARHLGAGPSGPGPGGRGDGVAANLQGAFPGTLRSKVLLAGRGSDDVDPWKVERLVWQVIEVLHLHQSDPVVAPLSMGYGPARRIADRFDRYHLHRPAMVRAWAAGQDVDPLGQPLPLHHRWQPHLWRLVRAQLGCPSPPEVLPGILEQIAAGQLAVDLPERLSLFGLSTLPGGPSFVDLALAVAHTRDVHLFLLDPSPALVEPVRQAALAVPPSGPRRRSDDTTAALVAHPLLRSWGRLPRETTTLMADAEAVGFPRLQPLASTPEVASPTLLQQVQQDLRAGRAPTGTRPFDPDDRSVQFHAAYGFARQVDVLRDALLHALEDHPGLTEDDIVVVCPALERFAPLVEAGLGPSAGTPGSWSTPHSVVADAPALRYRIADRSVSGTDPFTAGILAVLDAATSRFDAVDVLDLVALPAVRERYRFSDLEVARVADWVAEANIRWGLDTDHRHRFGLPTTITANSWEAVLDRLLVGSAVTDNDPGFAFGGVLPFGIEGDDVDLAGRLADLLARLRTLAAETAADRSLTAWLEVVRDTLEGIVAPSRENDRQPDSFHRVLAALAEEATADGEPSAVPLTFADVRKMLIERLVAAPGRPRFFGGGITVTSLNSLRWIPHRVVVLLGMDQAAFGQAPGDGDDLGAISPLVGDRDQRADGRQAVLEAVLAAGDQLIVIRDGHDVRTNQEIPPAVVVAELQDAVLATLAPSVDGRPIPIELHHPRQPFDERAVTDGGLVVTGSWSFDPGAKAAATARRARVAVLPPFLAQPLTAVTPDVIELADLHAVLADPVRAFLRHRLQVRLPEAEEQPSTVLPVEVTGLDGWKLGDRYLEGLRQGLATEEITRYELARGSITPGGLGLRVVEKYSEVARVVLTDAEERGLAKATPEPVTVDVALPDGTRIVGTVEDALHGPERGPVRLGVGRTKAKYRLAAWLDLMALVAHDPAESWRSVAVHKADNSKKQPEPAPIDLVPLGVDPAARRASALTALTMVVDLFQRSRREPIPFFPTLSYGLHQGEPKRSDWTDSMGWGEGDTSQVALTFGAPDFIELLALPAQPHDPPGPGERVERYGSLVWSSVENTSVDLADLDVDQEDPS